MTSDLRYALRALAARPAFSLTIVLTLGLGIGADAAIFSVVDALLLRPFPFADPDRLVRIVSVRGEEEGPLSVPEQDDLLALNHVFTDVALYTDQGMYNASGFGAPELPATITTHNLFRVLGVAPLVGSTFDGGADRSRRFELVISHGLWTRRFGQDPNIVGRTMTLDGAPGYTIHGVLPPGINFPTNADLFRSSGISADPKFYERREVRQRLALARLQAGVSVAQAQAEVDRLAVRLAHDFPVSNAGVGFSVTPVRDLYVGHVRAYVWLLFAAVALVLLVACANVASLLLSRGLARDRELALRLALGAGRARLFRLALAESGLLALLGGLVGLGVAYGGIRLVTALVPAQLPPWMRIEIEGMTLLFLSAAALAAGLVTGFLPALSFSDLRLHDALREGGRGSAGGRRHRRTRSILVVAEVALAMVLLAGASMMLQSVRGLMRVDPGFDPGNLLTFRVELGWRAYDSHQKVITFNDRLLDGLRTLPGVIAVGLDSNLPLSGRPREPFEVATGTQSADEQRSNPYVHQHVVSPGYLDAMRIALVRGRGFVETDTADSQLVALVSEQLAARLWPGQDAVGKSLRVGPAPASGPITWLTVAGVTRDIRLLNVANTSNLDVYRPYRQYWAGGSWFVARTAHASPERLAREATALVAGIDADQSFFDVHPMAERVETGVWQQRAAGALFGAFAALALGLAAVGLYGVLSFMVLQQQREIGVRIALGASQRAVLRTVLGRGLALTAFGLAGGLAGAVAASRAIQHLLFDVPTVDAITFVGVPLALTLVAAMACYLPARRAARVDPLITLRSE